MPALAEMQDRALLRDGEPCWRGRVRGAVRLNREVGVDLVSAATVRAPLLGERHSFTRARAWLRTL
jgi:hypothetical protein